MITELELDNHLCVGPNSGFGWEGSKSKIYQRVFPDEYSEMPLITDFQNFHKISLGVPKKNFITKKISPIPPSSPGIPKKRFFLEKILYSPVFEKKL